MSWVAPGPQRSVRPPDLMPRARSAVQAADPPPAVRRRRLLRELPVVLLVALVLAFGIKTFLVQAFYIPSGSMMDTLQVDDRVLVEKVSFRFRDPRRGEVVVFHRPRAPAAPQGPIEALRSLLEGLGLVAPDSDIDLIKRVVGLPGETVEIQDGVVHVDGAALSEPYARNDERDFGPLQVPAGHYFMLGDNRANSDDSRYGLGPVPREAILGRAFVILWPPLRATVHLAHDYPALEQAGAP